MLQDTKERLIQLVYFICKMSSAYLTESLCELIRKNCAASFKCKTT